ncbi:MAG TPA: ATP12 family protein [Pseudolabrys sp.]|nr:ATP12 family protein [Pseudolabrys sp.]
MREIFENIFEQQPLDPTEAARRAVRPQLRRRFYRHAATGPEAEGLIPLLLDGRLVRTPARRTLAAPAHALAGAIAAEWNAQGEKIDPATMPLTRLASTIIDGVADAPRAVADEMAKYLASDLLCYRADAPEGLVARQAAHWDPVLAWARERLGARFVPVQGVTYAAQPDEALAAARAAVPNDTADAKQIWKLGALSSITSLTGSALLALALAHGHRDADAAWDAAHVDEDWQMAQWGKDEQALERRAFRRAEFDAAVLVLREI